MSLDLEDPAAIAEAGEDTLYEVIDGVRVEKPMSTLSQFFGSYVCYHLLVYVRPRRLGRVFCEVLFRLPGGTHDRRPDAAYVSRERWSQRIPGSQPFQVVPELTVEVVSPTDSAVELTDKVGEYFDAGVSEVWVVYPERELVYRYTSLTNVAVFRRGDVLASAAAIPGFTLPLEDLFAEADDMGQAAP